MGDRLSVYGGGVGLASSEAERGTLCATRRSQRSSSCMHSCAGGGLLTLVAFKYGDSESTKSVLGMNIFTLRGACSDPGHDACNIDGLKPKRKDEFQGTFPHFCGILSWPWRA